MRDVQTQSVHDRLVRRLVAKIDAARETIARVDVDRDEEARVGILAYGATARPARGAVLRARAEGLAITFIRPVTLWPFPGRRIGAACHGLERLLVPEMNLGQIAREVERFVDCEVVRVGKIGGVVHSSGEILDAVRGGVT
jgi:2-oxoglutarate ferredoxin oxidoreductase subunit alpha